MAACNLLDDSLLDSMKHLTDEERRSILDVIKRAENLDKQASLRSKQLVTDYEDTASKVKQRRSSIENASSNLCPVCGVTPIGLPTGTNSFNACVDCELISCSNCGSYQLSSKTKAWVCNVCDKRRKAVLSSELQNIQHKAKTTIQRSKSLNYPDSESNMSRRRFQRQLTFDSHHDSSLLSDSKADTRDVNFLKMSDEHYFGIKPSNESREPITNSRVGGRPRTLSSLEKSPEESRITPHSAMNADKHLRETSKYSAQHHMEALNPNFNIPSIHCGDSPATNHAASYDRDLDHQDNYSPYSNERPYLELETSRSSHSSPRSNSEDYYLYEEEELSLIIQQSRHGHSEGDEYGSYSTDANSRPYQSSGHEWSPPITDLSPIMDVSSTLELQEEAEWLAEQTGDNDSDRLLPSKRFANQYKSPHNSMSSKSGPPTKPTIPPKQKPKQSKPVEFINKPTLPNSPQKAKPVIAPKPKKRTTLDTPQRTNDGIAMYSLLGDQHLANKPLIEQISDELMDRDKDSQSAQESGYESRETTGTVTTSESGSSYRVVYACDNQSLDLTDEMLSSTDERSDPKRKNSSETRLEDMVMMRGHDNFENDFEDFEDGVPVIAEGTTFNIHGGRDVFAKLSPIHKLPHQRSFESPTRSAAMRRSSSSTTSVKTIKLPTSSSEPKAIRPQQIFILSDESDAETPKVELPAPLSQTGTPTHASPITGKPLKDREIQVSPADREQKLRTKSELESGKMSDDPKPIPAPRRKIDSNSITGTHKSIASGPLESDDETMEIRFDGINKPMITRHAASGSTKTYNQSDLSHGLAVNEHTTVTIGSDSREADIQRSMDELRKREHDEEAVTKDLEKQLAEIRRMEERQRIILQNTLRQVVHSVHETVPAPAQKTPASSTETSGDELVIDNKIDYASLLSPSFNRKTPLSSPMLAQRGQNTLPSSPSKVRRHEMRTINENGAYNVVDLASMSPASSHRALSNMSSPLILSHGFDQHRKFQSLPPRSERLAQQAYQDMLSSGSLADPYNDSSFRLSASYTELFPSKVESDRSGYFSDRETERRRAVEAELKGNTDEARRTFLQFEIEKRRQQVEENNQLRQELQRLIQSGTIPAAQYERLREMYRHHINRSREYLRLSNSSLSSNATSISVPRGFDDHSYYTDSDNCLSSTEHLPGSISQSSTIERIMQSNESATRQKKQNTASTKRSSTTLTPSSLRPDNKANDTPDTDRTVSPDQESAASTSGTLSSGGNVAPMPLLEIKTPKSLATSPGTTEMVKLAGDMHRASSDASFGDPEEKLIDAKLEGGKALLKSSQRNEMAKQNQGANAMLGIQFNFPTKQILITPDHASRERGIGLQVLGGQPIGHGGGVTGAIVTKIQPGSVAHQLLGELKIGDEIVEWNGVGLRNRPDVVVQDIVSRWSGEIELTIRLDGQLNKLQRQSSCRSTAAPGSQYQSMESVKEGGFESPLSNKSWSKEFDESRQSTMKRAAKKAENKQQNKSPVTPTNELFPRMPLGDTEDQSELERKLSDMSEQLDRMNRESESLKEGEGALVINGNWNRQPSLSSVETDSEHPAPSYKKMGQQVFPSNSSPKPSQRGARDSSSLSPARNMRSSSDVGVRPDKSPSLNTTPNVERRASHVDRIKQKGTPPPISPRTGRHANHMMRLKDCGEIEAMLMYDYKRSLLIVRIERAVGLALREKKNLNPFIKVHFVNHTTIMEKRCTRYIESTSNPKWEQAFSFTVDEPNLVNYKIKMSAWDYHQPKQNLFIGTAIIDLTIDKHVDGNLRMYKLDSEQMERKVESHGGTPRMSRHTPVSQNRNPMQNASASPQPHVSPTHSRHSNKSNYSNSANSNAGNRPSNSRSPHKSRQNETKEVRNSPSRSSVHFNQSNRTPSHTSIQSEAPTLHSDSNGKARVDSPCIEKNNNNINPGQQKDMMRKRFINR